MPDGQKDEHEGGQPDEAETRHGFVGLHVTLDEDADEDEGGEGGQAIAQLRIAAREGDGGQEQDARDDAADEAGEAAGRYVSANSATEHHQGVDQKGNIEPTHGLEGTRGVSVGSG